MKIQYMSDLHIELDSDPVKKEDLAGDVLVMAGDIHIKPSFLYNYLDKLGSGIPIICVAGNHEFYHNDFCADLYQYKVMFHQHPFVSFLEDSSIVIQKTRFLGCTLWTDFFGGTQGELVERGMSDFHLIYNGQRCLTWEDVYQKYQDSLRWLTQELRKPFDGKTVVVTHHAPSALSNHPRYAGSRISAGFYSCLDDFIREMKPDVWIHGHMHESFDYKIGQTRILCNPYGYEGYEVNPRFDPRKMIEI